VVVQVQSRAKELLMKQTMLTRYTVIAWALVIGAGSAHAQAVSFKQGGAVVIRPSLAYIAATRDTLSDQYQQIAATAAARYATAADRQAFARFVRTAIMPQLRGDVAELYVTFDSLGGGGYAVPSALFDLETIDVLSKDVERSAATDTRDVFNARAFALNAVLQGFFAKTQLLVFPLVHDRQTKAALLSAAPQFPITTPYMIETVTP
jgi:hypothetical protein